VSQEPVTKSVHHCCANHTVNGDEQFSSLCVIVTVESSARTGHSIQEYMDDFSVLLSNTCPECRNTLIHYFLFACHPPLLCIELWHGPHLLEPVLHIDADSICQQYKLHGVIYFSGFYFTSRIITSNGMVWFHDSIFTGSLLAYELLNVLSIPVQASTLAVYIQDV